MAINFGRVGTCNEEIPSIKSPDPLITLLPQSLWPQDMAKWSLTIRNFNPLSYTPFEHVVT